MTIDENKYIDMYHTQNTILLVASIMSTLYIVSDINTYRIFNLSAHLAIQECFFFRCIPLIAYTLYYLITKFIKKGIAYIAPILAFLCVHIIHWTIIGCLTKLPDIQYSREGFIVILITLAFIGYTTTPKIFIPGLSLYFINCVCTFFIIKETTGRLAPLDQYVVTGFPLYLGFILALIELHKNWLERHNLYVRIKDIAYKDQLTGAYNRNYMQEYLIDSNAFLKVSGSILIVDIDNFKKINDTYGHLEGDNKLKQLVSAFQKNIRKSDFIVRYGGEEFLIIYKDCNEIDAYTISKRILVEVNKLGFSFSGGLGEINKNIYFKDNLKLIDSLLYYAKNNGKNQIVLQSSFT